MSFKFGFRVAWKLVFWIPAWILLESSILLKLKFGFQKSGKRISQYFCFTWGDAAAETLHVPGTTRRLYPGDIFRPHFPRRRGSRGGVWGEAPELLRQCTLNCCIHRRKPLFFSLLISSQASKILIPLSSMWLSCAEGKAHLKSGRQGRPQTCFLDSALESQARPKVVSESKNRPSKLVLEFKFGIGSPPQKTLIVNHSCPQQDIALNFHHCKIWPFDAANCLHPEAGAQNKPVN